MVLGEKKVVMLHWASQPWRVMWPASLRMLEEGKSVAESDHVEGRPGVAAKSEVSSEGERPPSLSLSKRRKRSTKKW